MILYVSNTLVSCKRTKSNAISGGIFMARVYNFSAGPAVLPEEVLREAGRYHFALEELYTDCMDFGSKEVFCNNFLDNLFY